MASWRASRRRRIVSQKLGCRFLGVAHDRVAVSRSQQAAPLCRVEVSSDLHHLLASLRLDNGASHQICSVNEMIARELFVLEYSQYFGKEKHCLDPEGAAHL